MVDSMTVSYVKNCIKSFSLIEIFSECGLLHLRLVNRKEFDEERFLTNIVHKIDGDSSHFKECEESHLMTAYDLNENGEIVNIASPAHLVHSVNKEYSTSNKSKYN
jgi:hypothetical protein